MNNKEKNEEINDIILLQNKKIQDLKAQLLNNKKRINDIELRKLANIENITKNTEKQIKTIKHQEIEKFLKTIIPIIDALEDTLTLSSKLKIKDEPLIEGIKLTLQSLLNILNRLGVKIEDENNKLFNPDIHTPVFIESSQKIQPDQIISIEKKGYSFNNVLLRKAIVNMPRK